MTTMLFVLSWDLLTYLVSHRVDMRRLRRGLCGFQGFMFSILSRNNVGGRHLPFTAIQSNIFYHSWSIFSIHCDSHSPGPTKEFRKGNLDDGWRVWIKTRRSIQQFIVSKISTAIGNRRSNTDPIRTCLSSHRF